MYAVTSLHMRTGGATWPIGINTGNLVVVDKSISCLKVYLSVPRGRGCPTLSS